MLLDGKIKIKEVKNYSTKSKYLWRTSCIFKHVKSKLNEHNF